jgi:ABC-type Fe3+ transport system permease subunit
MNDRELGNALLAFDASGSPDARQQTWHILERDRRRVRWLTGLAVVLWLVAALLVLGMFVAMGLLMPRMAKLAQEVEAGRVTAAERERQEQANRVTGQMITLGVAASVGVLALAALATVFLVLASRRATLRQINANLLAISEQLRQSRQ